MSTLASRARWAPRLLALFYLVGCGLLVVPFLLQPPAYLDLIPRDRIFATDLTGRTLQVTELGSGRTQSVAIERQAGGGFLAPLGRVESSPSTFVIASEGYQPARITVTAAPLQRKRTEVDLVPNFGRLQLVVVDAARRDSPLPATVRSEGRVLSGGAQNTVTLDLPAGLHSFTAESSGYCSSEADFEVHPGTLIRGQIPLAHAPAGEELARLVLGWHENPRDLDAHLIRSDASPLGPTHVSFFHKEGELDGAVYARLDVDYQHAEGFETITVLDRAEGDFDYYVARYAGDGTLGGSRAWVDVLTAGCQRRRFSVPPTCSEDVWDVARLHIHARQVAFSADQRCEPGTYERIGRVN